MTALIFYFALALGVSFVCSLLEAVMLSLSYGQIAALTQEGQACGAQLKALKDRIDRPLSAILTLNTVANTVGAAGVGAQALALAEEAWPGGNNNKWVALASGTLTLSILIFSEIIPKTLGVVYCRKLAPTAAYGVRGLVWLLGPVVELSERLARLVAPKGELKTVSREEMVATVAIGKAEGTLLGQESRIMQNLLRLNRVRAKEVLTPRSVVLAYQENMTVAKVVRGQKAIRFSRIPVYGKDLDDVTGVMHRYKVLREYSQGRGDTRLGDLASEVYAVPESKSVAGILEDFVQRQEQMFLVIDEYGGTAGIITLEDAIETLLGQEIVDEFDSVKDMRKLAREVGERRRKGKG